MIFLKPQGNMPHILIPTGNTHLSEAVATYD